MPQVTGDRFSSQNMADCAFCKPEGRRFRTTRQCATCARPLCLCCRVWIPQAAFLCPDCGGGPPEDSLHAPDAAVERLTAAGHTVPFWLTVVQEQIRALATPARPEERPEERVAELVEELIVPE